MFYIFIYVKNICIFFFKESYNGILVFCGFSIISWIFIIFEVFIVELFYKIVYKVI